MRFSEGQMSIPSGAQQKPCAFIDLRDKVKELLAGREHEFRSGIVMNGGIAMPFDARWMSDKLGWAVGTIVRTLKQLAEDPANHIVLRFKNVSNPDVIHIDTAVLEFIRDNEFDVIMGTGGFDAQFISVQLGLSRNFVANALRRLVKDPKNFIGLVNRDSDNPAPIRDYGTSRDSAYAATVAG
ncbi:MAG: hypothetical protein HYT82_01240 [Candidatus Harrisonbacteria bacterium]|nr:hypothetical protein [Candidatus Harrisonbacteria bacterium]MBI2406196.1 hypothetical protein [Candidatus Harrisonbacteria bacterium]